MPTIKDIAKAAGVSPASVSRVINNGPKVGPDLRAKIKHIMAEMGYYPNANAQSLNSTTQTSLGIVLPNLIDPIFSTFAHGIEKIASQQGTQILMKSTNLDAESELSAIQSLFEHKCHSMIVYSQALKDEKLVELANQNQNLILINRYIHAIKSQCIWADELNGGVLISDYLLAHGHQKFAMIDSELHRTEENNRSVGTKCRLSEKQLIVEYSTPSFEGGEIATQNVLAQSRDFTALIAYNDAMAAGAIAMLNSNGLSVPEDVSVVGFDDTIFAQYAHPQLTTIKLSLQKMAEQAAIMALSIGNTTSEQANNGSPFLPELILRQSVRDIRGC